MFGAKLSHESKMYVGGFELPGIESFSFSSSHNASLVKPLGTTKGFTSVSGPMTKSMSITRSLLYRDPVLHRCTGYGKTLAASIVDEYGQNYYGFKSGYLSSYSVNCAVGAVPRVTTNFNIADEIESGVNSGQGVGSLQNRISIPTKNTLSVDCPDFNGIRIVGFDYSLNRKNKAFYTIGSTSVSKMETISPIEYKATVQVELDQSYGLDLNKFFDERQNKKLDFLIKGRNNKIIQQMPIPNATLAGQNLSQSSNGLMKLNLNYNGHLDINTYGL